MRIYLIAVLFSFLFWSCDQSAVRIPSDVLPKDTMVNVLMDIHIAEAGVRTLVTDSLNYKVKEYYYSIFEKYHITDVQFKTSMRFYTEHPRILEEIYQKMIEKMSEKEAEVLKAK